MNVDVIAHNNDKYGEWWCEHFSHKVDEIMKALKNQTQVNRKLLRVKLYNSVSQRIEEYFLYDLLKAKLNANQELLPKQNGDNKNQVCIWGPFFIAHRIYNVLHDKFHSPAN
tara:strand:+ start:450 stop:785 length:336 start_codon:yes stop_codon:yes gene_type:complete